MNCDCDQEETTVIRQMNKTLRTVNKGLRSQLQQSGERVDEMFLALCETDPSAELAMETLWASGLFDCGPQDYQYIVERVIEAMTAQVGEPLSDSSAP
jgi:hypothetical protein